MYFKFCDWSKKLWLCFRHKSLFIEVEDGAVFGRFVPDILIDI